MTPITTRIPIVADGVYSLPPNTPGVQRIVEFSGDFGGGTLSVGYVSLHGDFVPFTAEVGGAAIEFTSADALVVDTPASGTFAVQLAGSVEPSITLALTTITG
jgi:hypothetical protein